MCDATPIVKLFANVLYADLTKHRVKDGDVITGIRSMTEVYKPHLAKLRSDVLNLADYSLIAHRCAYLHKYATFHAVMVCDMLIRAFEQAPAAFFELVVDGNLTMCSLGAGPGSDVVGVVNMIQSKIRNIFVSATLVDFFVGGWSLTFDSVLDELNAFGRYGSLGANFKPDSFMWEYLGANLLLPLSDEVKEAISSSKLVTMIKFVSAAACRDTSDMLQNILDSMKPGALILFIDNDAGGFRQLMNRLAQQNKFVSVFGPLNHQHYSNDSCNVRRFGYVSCHQTTVTVHLMQKPKAKMHPFLSPPAEAIRRTLFPVDPNQILNPPKKFKTGYCPQVQAEASAPKVSSLPFSHPRSAEKSHRTQNTEASKMSNDTVPKQQNPTNSKPGRSESSEGKYPSSFDTKGRGRSSSAIARDERNKQSEVQKKNIVQSKASAVEMPSARQVPLDKYLTSNQSLNSQVSNKPKVSSHGLSGYINSNQIPITSPTSFLGNRSSSSSLHSEQSNRFNPNAVPNRNSNPAYSPLLNRSSVQASRATPGYRPPTPQHTRVPQSSTPSTEDNYGCCCVIS